MDQTIFCGASYVKRGNPRPSRRFDHESARIEEKRNDELGLPSRLQPGDPGGGAAAEGIGFDSHSLRH